jgi:hypothetical protein
LLDRLATAKHDADLAELDTAENRAAWMNGTVEEWDTASLLLARVDFMAPGTDSRLKSCQKLGEEYMEIHLPIVRRRMCQSGLRLSWVLNEAFSTG